MAKISISGYLTDGTTAFDYEINPNSIETSVKNIGEDIQSIDGTNHRFFRGYKREFKLTFTNVKTEVVDKLYTVFTTPNEFIFKDYSGTSYKVYTALDSFSKNLEATNVSLQKVPVYTVSIGLNEV